MVALLAKASAVTRSPNRGSWFGLRSSHPFELINPDLSDGEKGHSFVGLVSSGHVLFILIL